MYQLPILFERTKVILKYLLELELNNYKAIEECSVNFLKQGLTLILGNTDDPLSPSNGAGKSTIRSGICWNWFGVTPSGQKGDNVLSWFNKKDCYTRTVVCDGFDANNNPINKTIIERYRNHSKYKNSIRVSVNDIVQDFSDNADAQTILNGLLGFDYQTFCSLLTSGSNGKKLTPIPLMTDAEFKEFIDELLNLDYINVAKTLITDDIKAKRLELISIDNEINSSMAVIDSSLSLKADYETKIKEYSVAIDKRKQELFSEIAKNTNAVTEFTTKINKAKDFLQSYKLPEKPEKPTDEIDAINEKIIKGNSEYNKLKNILLEKRNTYEDISKTLKTKIISNVTTKELKDALMHDNVYTLLVSKKAELENFIKDHQSMLSVLNYKKAKPELTTEQLNNIKLVETSIKQLENEKALVVSKLNDAKKNNKNINALHDNVNCSLCGQTITSDYKTKYSAHLVKLSNDLGTDLKVIDVHIAEFNQKIAESKAIYISDNTKEVNALIDQETSTLKDLNTAYANEINKITEYEAKTLENLNKDKEKHAIAEDAKRIKELTVLKDSIVSLEQSTNNLYNALNGYNTLINNMLSEYNKQVEEYQKLVDVYNDKKNILSEYEVSYNYYNTKLNDLKIELSSLDRAKNPYIELKDTLENKLAALDTSIKELRLKKDIINDDLKVLAFWEVGFGNSGLKSFILDSVIDLLNTKVNKCLNTLTNGLIKVIFDTQKKTKSDELRDKFTINIKKNGYDASYSDDLSTGEKARTNLAINYAMQFLAETYHNTRLNFMFCDETLDGVDEVGSAQIIKFLREELERFESIFVVSHNRYLQKMFDKEIIVYKENDRSRVIC